MPAMKVHEKAESIQECAKLCAAIKCTMAKYENNTKIVSSKLIFFPNSVLFPVLYDSRGGDRRDMPAGGRHPDPRLSPSSQYRMRQVCRQLIMPSLYSLFTQIRFPFLLCNLFFRRVHSLSPAPQFAHTVFIPCRFSAETCRLSLVLMIPVLFMLSNVFSSLNYMLSVSFQMAHVYRCP